MQIFLSWSGNISREIAEIFKQMLEDCFYEKVSVFMSAKDILLGTNGINTIFNTLTKSDMCIAFITPININAPWIAFEAGAVAGSSNKSESNNEKRVIPLLFGNIDIQKFNKNPLHNYQYATASLDKINELCIDIAEKLSYNNIIKTVKQIEIKTKKYYSIIKKLSEQIPGTGLLKSKGFVEFLSSEYSFGTSLQGEIAEFENGFETPELYRAILKYVDKQLYVLGRKNTKLFSNSNRPFFYDLKEKIKKGFDFKCLFLSPESEYVSNAQNDTYFLMHLKDRIVTAQRMINDEELFDEICRGYNVVRNTAIIIADDVVIFSPITYDTYGTPTPLTYADFFVTDKNSEIGNKYLKQFNEIWKKADNLRPLNDKIVSGQ